MTAKLAIAALGSHRTRRAALVALARALGYEGRVGGWVYSPAGVPLCQGWAAFLRLAALGSAVDRAGDPALQHMPLADEYGGRWLVTDRGLAAIYAQELS